MTASNSKHFFHGTIAQVFAVLVATLNAISDGMQYGWSSPVLPILLDSDSPLPITESEGEWLETSMWMGALLMLPITIYLVDILGRKKCILMASIFLFFSWIIIAVAPRVEYLYVARALAGAASNVAYVATPMYIAEIAGKKIRGLLCSTMYINMLIGILLIYVVAPFVPIWAHCILGATLAAVVLVIFPFMPESPYFLLLKGDSDGASNVLKRLRGYGVDIDQEISEIKDAVSSESMDKGRFIDLFSIPSNRRAMITMLILNLAQHFSSISVLLMNLHYILEKAGAEYSIITEIIFASILVIAATIASLTVDKFGRKTLLISSSILTGICVLILAIYFNIKNLEYNLSALHWIPIVTVMFYACSFKLGLGLVPIVLVGELFPPSVKAYGVSLSDASYVVASLLSLQVYERLKNIGLEYPFYVFGVSCFLTSIFIHFFVPETKGKSLEEVQIMLKGSRNKQETDAS